MKKLLTKLEKRDIIDKHSNERAQKQRYLRKPETAWTARKRAVEGTEMDRKNRMEETAEARWLTGKKFKTLKKEI